MEINLASERMKPLIEKGTVERAKDVFDIEVNLMEVPLRVIGPKEAIEEDICHDEREVVLKCVEKRRVCGLAMYRVKQKISPNTPLVVVMRQKPGLKKENEEIWYGKGISFVEWDLAFVWEKAGPTLLHETGHLKGLEHCEKEKCIMNQRIKYARVVQGKKWDLCDGCQKKLEKQEKDYE